jgi:2-(1,2-epoxy-1,2-dihydrophenyl)acetyl-CoA isomerase
MPMSETIQLTRQGAVAILTLTRPESLNSLDVAAIKALLSTLRTLADDASVRALVITGAGRAFCAGWQLEDDGVPGLADESLGVRQSHLMEVYFDPVIQTLHDFPGPTLAAVNGVCAGLGVSLALAADIAVAADGASFVLTFAPRLGLVPDLGATWKLPRLIGWARAQAVTMLGEPIPAETAERWGMIWRQVPAAALMQEAMALAGRLADAPAGICREARHCLAAAQLNTLQQQMDDERLRQRALLDKPSFAEGLRAFREKRRPDFHR